MDETTKGQTMQLNVSRTELITALTEKRDEVGARIEKKIAKVQERIDAITPAESTEGWFRQVADLLRDEKVTAEIAPTMSSGRADRNERVYLVVRSSARKRRTDEHVVPSFPRSNQGQISSLKADLNHWKNRLAEAVEPYDAALRILNMSSDEKIGIQDGDYHGLLAGKPAGRSRRVPDDFEDEDEDEDEYEDTSLRP